jgi:hypothetical protein
MEAQTTTQTSDEAPEIDGLADAADPIRIAPLHIAGELLELREEPASTARPELTYRGGHLLTQVRVFTTFWGDAWSKAPQGKVLRSINEFFADIVSGKLIDQLTEYNVKGQKIRHGQMIGSATVPGVHFKSSITDGALRRQLQHLIATDARFPKPTSNTLYFVYLPPGVVLVQGGDRSCQAFCGYHEHIDHEVYYAAMPWPGCGGCLGPMQALDALTSTSSHELCEAITDPVPGQGWYDDTYGEIGDICPWKTRKLGKWTVQLEWSNWHGACI